MIANDPARELRLLRIDSVVERTGVSRVTIYRLVKDNKFPKPAKIGASTVWPEHEVQAYIQQALDDR